MEEKQSKKSAQRKPNIVIVMTDQHRADLRAACGYPLDTMPFLDQWAKAGIDFQRAYTPNPCCIPARISMFTGRYPSCHNVRTNHNVEDVLYGEDLLDVLKCNGYKTALCGKNHTHRKPTDFDFCELNGHLAGHISNSGEVNRSTDEIEFASFLNSTKHMETHIPSPGGVCVQHPYKNVSSALKFLDEERGDAPFFLWLSFAEPHNPYQVPEPYFNMFPPESLPKLLTTVADLPAKGPSFEWERAAWERVLGDDIENRILRARSNYLGMLRLIDDQFKRFIEGLEKRGLRENTIVVFTSDHGDYAGEYGLIRKGCGLPESLVRITMIWQGPCVIQTEAAADACISLVDILPTVCDLLGVEIPFGAQGRSLLPLLRGETCPPGEFDLAYSEAGYGGLYWTDRDLLKITDDGAITDGTTFVEMSSWTASGQMRMVRKGDYKIQMDMMGKGYLYNLQKDPAEVNNLWDNPEYLSIKVDMLACFAAAILRASDPIPAPHNRYRTKRHPKGFWYDKDYIASDPGVRKDRLADYVLHKTGP